MTIAVVEVLTRSGGLAVELHQVLLGQVLLVLLARVVLLGHLRVVEGRLADGAEAVGVFVATVTAVASCSCSCRLHFHRCFFGRNWCGLLSYW